MNDYGSAGQDSTKYVQRQGLHGVSPPTLNKGMAFAELDKEPQPPTLARGWEDSQKESQARNSKADRKARKHAHRSHVHKHSGDVRQQMSQQTGPPLQQLSRNSASRLSHPKRAHHDRVPMQAEEQAFLMQQDNAKDPPRSSSRKLFAPPEAQYSRLVGGSMVRHGRHWFNWWLPVVSVAAVYVFHHSWERCCFWGIEYTTLQGAPEARAGRYELSLRETRDELVRAGMPHLGHFLFDSSHVFRYTRVVLNVLLWYWPVMPDLWRLQAFAVLEFLGKWSLWEVVALALLLAFGDLSLESDAGEHVWRQHVWLGQGAVWYLAGLAVTHVLGCYTMHEVQRVHDTRAEQVMAENPSSESRSARWDASYSTCIEAGMMYGRLWYFLVPVMLAFNVVVYCLAMNNPMYMLRAEAFEVGCSARGYTLLESAEHPLQSHKATQDDARAKTMLTLAVVAGVLGFPCVRMCVHLAMWGAHVSGRVHDFLASLLKLCNQCSLLDVAVFTSFLAFYKSREFSHHLLECNEGSSECLDVDVDPKLGYNYAVASALLTYMVNAVICFMAARAKEVLQPDPSSEPLVRNASSV